MEEYSHIPHPFKPGDRYYSNGYVYEVVRLTPKRAYFVRLTDPAIRHVDGIGGLYLQGNNETYVDTVYWNKAKADRLLPVPREHNDMLLARVQTALDAMVPHHKRLQELEEEKKRVVADQRADVIAIMSAK